MGRKRKPDSVDCSTIHPHFETMLWVEAPTPEISYCKVGEVILWRRVITTAISDYCNTDESPAVQLARKNAERWLLKNEKQFRAVCSFADIDADKLRKMVNEIDISSPEALAKIKFRVTKL